MRIRAIETGQRAIASNVRGRFVTRITFFLMVAMTVYLPPAHSYNEVSPHWDHIRTILVDFRTIYLADDVERASQYDWGARHYDVVMGDGVVRNDTVYEYKRRNPGLKWYAYATNWTFMLVDSDFITTAWYTHMQNWYSNHPEYDIEDAFIHDTNACPQGSAKTAACRLRFFLWDSFRFVIYPADPGLQAYQAQRMKDIVTVNTYGGYEPDGVFFDEHASWSIDEGGLGPFNGRIREYPGVTDQVGAYTNDLVGLLQIERNALGPNKSIMLNIANVRREHDFQMVVAAGSGFLEMTNDPAADGLAVKWEWAERILNAGASVMFSYEGPPGPANYTAGNSASSDARYELAALASYYMVVPNPPDNFAFERDSPYPPFEQIWHTAIETSIGSPLGPRSVYREGTDPNGWNYRIWARDFGNALVLSRPIAAWNYQTFDDTTAVTVTLPAGDTYRPLNSDGTRGAPVNSITLRNAEAAILIKQNGADTLAPAAPTNLTVQ